MHEILANHDIPVRNMIQQSMGVNTTYIKDRLDKNEQLLIVARSKADISDIKQVITDCYQPLYPGMKILDLTTIQAPNTSYGTLMAKHYSGLCVKYPNGISVGQFFFELYNILSQEISNTESPYTKSQYEYDKDNATEFAAKHLNKFGDYNTIYDVKTITEILINIESTLIQEHSENIKNNVIIDLSEANIVLSTIHTATDIRCDNVVVFMKNMIDKIDTSVYRVALSRANKSEYIIFANYGMFETQYQKYIKTHLI
jgi:hypothetical protein